jgi:hypothetical protein
MTVDDGINRRDFWGSVKFVDQTGALRGADISSPRSTGILPSNIFGER